MILDTLLQLGSAQAFTSTGGYTTYSLDLGNVTPKRRIGIGEALTLMFVVTTAAAGDSGTMTDTFDLLAVASANADLSSHVELIKRRVAGAKLVAGAVFDVPIPICLQSTHALRYLGGRVEMGAGGDTVSVSTFIIPRDHVDAWLSYAKNYSV